MHIFRTDRSFPLNRRYLSQYTLLFLITYALAFGFFFLILRRSFMWDIDAYEQHYLAFVYIGRLGRSFLRGLFPGQPFAFRMWENGIGYGGDVITTFTTYLGDPFNWLSVLFPSAWSEYAYNLMVLLKLWCCGLSFTYYSLCRGNSESDTLAGAVTYALCGTTFISFFSHNFVNPMLIFPLLITGADRLFEKNRSGLYLFSLFWAFVNYFYFAYMMCILLVIYCVLKVLFSSDLRRHPAEILKLVGRFLTRSLLSAGMASFVLIPILLVLSKMNRLNLDHYLPMFYSKSFYGTMFSGFIDAEIMLGRDCMIGFGSFSLICVFVLFLHRGYQTQLKAEFLLAVCGLCLPFFGHVMNGFSYMANRWVWAVALIVAEIVTVSIPLLRRLSRRKAAAVLTASLLYAAIMFLFFRRTGLRNICTVALLLALSVLSFSLSRFSEIRFRKVLSAVLILSLAVPGYFFFFPGGSFRARESRKLGTCYPDALVGSGLPAADLPDPSGPVRWDVHVPGAPRNASWISGNSSIDFYISMYNGNIDRFHDRLGLHTSFMNFSYKGVQQRSELAALMGVGHAITAEDPASSVPYRYSQEERTIDSKGTILRSFTRPEKASLFYLFDQGVSAEEAGSLPPEEYQQLIMNACIVPAGDSNTDLKEILLSEDEISAELFPQEGVEWDPAENSFLVKKNNSELILQFEETAASELYLLLDDLEYTYKQEQYYTLSADTYLDGQKLPCLSGTMEGSTPYSHLNGGQKQWMLHLGYTDQPVNNLHLIFKKQGLYHIGNLCVYARKKQDLDQTHLLLNSPVRNASYEPNHFSCDVTTARPQYLFMSIPGPDGWTCFDNGKKIPLIPTDEAFMSVKLAPGEHHIDLSYKTPGLLPGILVSLFSLLISIYLLKHQNQAA